MMPLLRKSRRVLLAKGPLIPNAESDEETPTIVNVFLTLGMAFAGIFEPPTQLFFIGFYIFAAAIAVKFVFNFVVSTEATGWGRAKHSLWVLFYHPLLGRPYRVIAMIRESETRAELAGSLYCAAMFYAVVVFSQFAFPFSEMFGK